MKKLSIIIPVYNEQATIRQIISKVKKLKIKKIKTQIIVVNDASADKTNSLLKKISGITLLRHSKNLGKGAAIHTALKKVTGDYVLIQDADLEYDTQDIPLLIEPIITKKAKVVYGSRFLGPHKNMLFWHMIGNKILSFVTNILYNTTLSDMEVGYKLFPSKLLKSLSLNSKRFGFEPEVTSKILKLGYRIYEVPISYNGREFDEGKKITWKDAVIAFFILVKNRIFS